MAKKILRIAFILMILVANIGCDQISKNIARQKIEKNEQINVIDNYVTLTKVENTGAFLSFGNEFPIQIKNILLIFLPLIVIVFVIRFLLTKSKLSKLTIIGLCSIIGGGIGNIYDRIIYGSVTDFLHINFVIFQTGIFNMGDVSIMFGMFLLLIDFIIKEYFNAKTPQL
jgi:signal peptidase II